MHWLDPLLAYAGLLAWGGHAAVPWRLSRGADEASRRAWRLAAPLLWSAGVLAFVLEVAHHPDRAVAAGLGSLPLGSSLALALTLATGLLAAADGVVLAAGPRLEDLGWRLAAVLALPALAGFVWAEELLRAGGGPVVRPGLAMAAAVCRAAVALAAGEVLVPRRRPLASLLAPPALAAYFLLLPGVLAGALTRGGDLLTLAAAALLLGAARWLPRRLRRPALAGGGLLAAVFFARAAALAEALPPPPA